MSSEIYTVEYMKMLLAKKDELEAEFTALKIELTAPGGPGLKGGLIDAEGFPRADVDIPRIRLQTDHAELMKEIEKGLAAVHSARRSAPTADTHTTSAATAPSATAAAPAVAAPQSAFAVVDQVFHGSPAESDGLREGDRVIRFGNVDASNFKDLQAVADITRQAFMSGGAIAVEVERGGARLQLEVRPRDTWAGRGVLGCHFTKT